MKLTFLVNQANRVQPDQSTALLMHAAALRGWEVQVTGVGDLSVAPDGTPHALVHADGGARLNNRADWITRLRLLPQSRVSLLDSDAVFIRTNPARDAARVPLHDAAMGICRIARDRGLAVMNDPDGLARASSKLFISRLPVEVRPATLVSRNADELMDFVRSRPEATVLKPLSGTQGTDVFRVQPDEPFNLRQIVDVLARQGYAMAQAWVPEATDGDVRLLVLNGAMMEVGGKAAAVRRVPASGEFRSNVHRGGSPQPTDRVDHWQPIVDAIRPMLMDNGLFFVGLDLIGDRIVEVNVFSPGGMLDAQSFAGVDFCAPVLDAIAERVAPSGG